jgi:hypothetical protein
MLGEAQKPMLSRPRGAQSMRAGQKPNSYQLERIKRRPAIASGVGLNVFRPQRRAGSLRRAVCCAPGCARPTQTVPSAAIAG